MRFFLQETVFSCMMTCEDIVVFWDSAYLKYSIFSRFSLPKTVSLLSTAERVGYRTMNSI